MSHRNFNKFSSHTKNCSDPHPKNCSRPSIQIAKATPPILPVPTAPDIAVVNASNGDVSPSALSLEYLPVTILQP